MSDDKAALDQAIANCDRDPIHIPGTIQHFGALIAADSKLTRIEFASETTETFLGFPAQRLLGEPVSVILGDADAHEVRNLLSLESIETQRALLGEREFLGVSYEVSVHRKGRRAIIEFLPVGLGAEGRRNALDQTRSLLGQTVGDADFRSLMEASVEKLRAQTGYDRVMAYRFLPDGAGEVIAESRASHMDSFLGLRFPATDIPQRARTLYAETPIRVIADVNAEDVPILGLDPSAEPLDLSLAVLRGTADMHIRYLQNMGVKGTLTVPITVNGKLWGLFAAHRMSAGAPDPEMLMAAELSGKVLSLVVVQHASQIRHEQHLRSCASIANHLFVAADSELSISTYWQRNQARLTEMISSDGFAYVVADRVELFGSTPDVQGVRAVLDLASSQSERVVFFDDLTARFPDAGLGETAGALAIKLSENAKASLVFFRDEVVRQVTWAGVPQKEITTAASGPILTPRNSFAQYSEAVKGRSDEWTSDDLEVAAALGDALSQALETQSELKENRHRLGLLVRELNHRVRNILTLVQSLSHNTKGSATSIEGFAKALEQRIVALAGAHDLLTRDEMRGARLDQIASLELRPYLDGETEAASLSGPEVMLNADVSPILALVLHELTTNAVKYGALSTPEGRVSLSWKRTEGSLEIEWRETGGPPVSHPTREGFGRSIIESAIPYEFNGEAEAIFDPGGLVARFRLSEKEFESVVPMQADLGDPAPQSVSRDRTRLLDRGLIVEDSFVIAGEMKRWLSSFGFQEVMAVPSVAEALSLLDAGSFDFCLLDVNLRGEMSKKIAERLVQAGIPFIFSSGYGSAGREICDCFEAPFLTKPVELDELREELNKMGFEIR